MQNLQLQSKFTLDGGHVRINWFEVLGLLLQALVKNGERFGQKHG